MRPLTSPPASDSSVALADWVELHAIAHGVSKLSKSTARAFVRESLGGAPEQIEELVELLFAEIERRIDLIGLGYPFSKFRSGFRVQNTAAKGAYAFLLLLAASPSYRQSKAQNPAAIQFEFAVEASAEGLLGARSRAVRFGTPPSGERPAAFEPALKWLASLLSVTRGPGKQNPKKQDAGVDVVAWLPFEDQRAGTLVVLCQATIEIGWWSSGKHKDINPDAWYGWLDLGSRASIGFFIPFVLPTSFAHWDELRRHVHIIMDRVRICATLREDWRLDSIDEWVQGELKALHAAT